MAKILIGRGDTDLDYPICRPSLDLDFTQEVLDPRITFSRGGSVSTRVNRNRLIETVSANQPRFDYDPVTGECKGLLIEESRSNLVQYSEQFDNAYWAEKRNTSVSVNSITAPDGNTTADKLVESTTNVTSTEHSIISSTITWSGNTRYTFSLFAKAGERTRFDLLLGTGSNWVSGRQVAFDLVSETILSTDGATGTITRYPNGWYRCSVTGLTIASPVASLVALRIINTGTNAAYQGDGTSGIYIWGAQLEAGAFPTSYIPTTASTVTRSADLASITGTNFSSWYNDNEGTLYASARINALGGTGYPGIVYVDDGTLNNCIGLVFMDASNDVIAAESYASGSNQYFLNSSVATIPNQLTKGITAYQQNNFASAFSNRVSVASDRNGVIPTVNRMIIGDLRGGNGKLNGTISRLTYHPRRLKDNQLQYLTQ